MNKSPETPDETQNERFNMALFNPIHLAAGFLLLLSAIGVLMVPKPVHAALSFLGSLMMLAVLYFTLSAEFIAVLQVLIYAGAILVIFMFVIILFQDVHEQLNELKAKSKTVLVGGAAAALLASFIYFGVKLIPLNTKAPARETLPKGYGYVENLGTSLYVDYFFPFEAVVVLFMIALIGALYLAKKVPARGIANNITEAPEQEPNAKG